MQTCTTGRCLRHAPLGCILLTALLTGGAYWPGLAGDFLFDDYVNLNALGRYGGVHDWPTLLYYLTSGIADPTGRPVAMLSFLIDSRDWPADPWPFKRTNLAIHLLTGLLLYSVLSVLGRRLTANQQHAELAAALAAGIWMAHPLWASTVLYVVQRHAMLAALFVLAGIRTWVASRNAFEQGRRVQGWVLALIAVPLFGLLAGLSKANGFLLPLLLAVLQTTVLRPDPSTSGTVCRRDLRLTSTLLVWLPSLALLGWLAQRGIHTALMDSHWRPWSLGQRLLTQPRALCEYLWQLLVPGLNATGVFADGFSVSRSWREPWTTLPALAAIAALAAIGWTLRRKWPVFASAVLFFLAGHILESSVVMLELYFEHRNYLPAALLFWPFAWWLTMPGSYLRWRLLAGTGFLSVCLLTAAAQARLWGDPLSLAVNWAQHNPNSARAQAYASSQERSAGLVIQAERRLALLAADHPSEPQYALNLLDLRCDIGRASTADIVNTTYALAHSKGLALDMNYHWLAQALLPGADNNCPPLDTPALATLLEAATTSAGQPAPGNTEIAARHQRLLAHLALREGRCTDALAAFNRRIDAQRRPEFAHTQAGMLATHCGHDAGLAHLQHYLSTNLPYARPPSLALRLRDQLMLQNGYWEDEIQQLRALLESER